MNQRHATKILKIAALTVLAGTVPVGEILPAESGARPAAGGAPGNALELRPSGKAKVRSALLTSEEIRALPREIYSVILKNDQVLWARTMTRNSDGFEIQPITGGKIQVTKSQVIEVKQISRGAYLALRWKEIQTARRSALSASPASRSVR